MKVPKYKTQFYFCSFQMSDETLDNVDKAHSLLHTVFDLHKCLYIPIMIKGKSFEEVKTLCAIIPVLPSTSCVEETCKNRRERKII